MLYRTRRSHAFACLFGGVPLIAIGLGGMILCLRANPDFVDEGGILAFFGLIAAVGVFGVVAAFNVDCRRITLDAEGFARHSLLGMRRVEFEWTDVDSWLTWPVKETRPVRESAYLFMKADGSLRPTPTGRAVVFRFRSGRPAVFVPEQEVSQPSFERFLADVRREIGARELRPGAPTAPAPAVVDAIQLPTATAIEPVSRRDR
jgi:hypothetical protein